MINQKKKYDVNKEIRTKTPMLRPYSCDFSDAYIVVKGDIAVQNQIMQEEKKVLHLKIINHSSTAFQRSMVYSLTMQKI